jgi:hypothetical protein
VLRALGIARSRLRIGARALNDTANAARKAAQPVRIKPQKSNKIGRSRTICRSSVPHLPRGEVAHLFIGFDALGSVIAASQLSPAPLTIEERLAESGVASFFRVARASVCVPVALANLLAHLQGRALNNQRDTPPNSSRSQSSSGATHKSCHLTRPACGSSAAKSACARASRFDANTDKARAY